MPDIIVKGARQHNLRDVDLTLPHNKLICFTGVSGSGKSSLAFDTLYAEGQRRYIESFSSYARQFLGQLQKPDVDRITGLSPSISISQKTGGQNTRSTVGTITEINDFLRVLYARVGVGYCPRCHRPVTAQTKDRIIDRLSIFDEGTVLYLLAPVVREQKGEFRDLFSDLRKQGFLRIRVDGTIVRLDDDLKLDRQLKHNIEVVIDRLTVSDAMRPRLAESVEQTLRVGHSQMLVIVEDATQLPDPSEEIDQADRKENVLYFSTEYACTSCNISFEPPTPQMFSFNSPVGMCPHCQGLGYIHTFDPALLVPDGSKSLQQGCVVPLGKWKELGRWKRHIYQGVSDTLCRTYNLEKNYPLETAWDELDDQVKQAFLWGTGDMHVTFTWRSGPSGHKWGGKFEGIIPRMMKQYTESNSKIQIASMEKYMNVIPCGHCGGHRLNEQASAFKLETLSDSPVFAKQKIFSLPELNELAIVDLVDFFSELKLSESGHKIAEDAIKEIRARLGFLKNVGLDYLSLGRTAPTLSGGELQRIRLAGQIGSGLVGVLYVLDEPSIGLHPRDNQRLIDTLASLRDLGNTVVVVEHDEDTMLAADYLVDFGPGPGQHGGRIVANGPVADVLKQKHTESLTTKYLLGEERIPLPAKRRELGDRKLVIRGASHNNLKNIDVEIPLGGIVCVTGVSGSGKSSLVDDILLETLMRDLNHGNGNPGKYESITGLKYLDKLIAIDQSPIGRTPRSNPATYIKLFDEIRKLFSELPESRQKGFQPGRFSFNVAGGRCEACEGNGAQKLEMDFLADVWVTCPICGGHRFNQDTLSVQFKGKSIDQILDMDVETALKHFANIPRIKHKLQTLYNVGLRYMKLGQPSPSLSGGEAQRIKLAKELVKKSTGKTLYLLDEPTTGLHFADIRMLIDILENFADAGNTVLIVEHNLDVVKIADWIIDMGPEGGAAGGYVVAQGTPEQIMENPASHTGVALKQFLARQALTKKELLAKVVKKKSKTKSKTKSTATDDVFRVDGAIVARNVQEHNLRGVTVSIPRDAVTVCCGPSGSGKTSLAMDTIYAEGQRRYVESLSSYARQFLGQMQKPKVDQISGISPAIAIEQKTSGHSPRSTVGTVTEIYDYLRVLFARLGVPYCPDCNIPIGTQSTDEIVARVLLYPDNSRIMLVAPLTIDSNTDYAKLWEKLQSQGFLRVRIDGTTHRLGELPEIDRKRRHDIEVVVDRVHLKNEEEKRTLRSRIAGSVETVLNLSQGLLKIVRADESKPEPQWESELLSRHLSCTKCGRGFEPLTPHHFSFNSPLGWCPHCEGLGVTRGTCPTHMLRDPELTLRQGALSLWTPEKSPTSLAMLLALSRETEIPVDVPFEQLDARFRRMLFHGAGERWFDVFSTDLEQARGLKPGNTKMLLFRFQYKGLYPSVEEAARLVPSFRGRLEYQVEETECSVCLGSRLRDDVSAVRFLGLTMDQICRKPLGELLRFFDEWTPDEMEKKVADDLINEVHNRLAFLVDVGLDYLTLARPAASLSGGESQRIRLAAQIGSGLVGVLYVLDEPTIGLHPRDNKRLIGAMEKLRALGNTLLVVEHDREMIESADYVIDFGPGAGKEGGLVVAEGTPQLLADNSESVTGVYLSGTKSIPIPTNRRIGAPRKKAT